MTMLPTTRQRAFGFCLLLAALSGALDAAAATPAGSTFVLPWVAPSIGALVQTSDLYLHNPGPGPITATLVFRKRGTPDVNPPTTHRTVAPGATLYASDVLRLFKGAQGAGSVIITTSGDVAPVVTSFNNTFTARGGRVGHAVAQVDTAPAGPGDSQALVGLRQDSTFSTTVFLFNPSDGTAVCELSLLGLDGSVLGSLPAVQIGPGSSRSFDGAHLPLPAGARTGPFSVQVTVDRGLILSAAQVLNKANSDAAFVQGQTR